MPIPVGCPTCGAVLPVPDEFAGAAVRCGGCNHPVQVPAAGEPPPLPVARRVPVLKRTEDEDRPRPARRSPRPVAAPTLTAAGRVWLAVLGTAAAGGCVTLLIAAAGGVRTATAAPPAADRPVQADRRPALVPPPAQVFAPEPVPDRPRQRPPQPHAFEPLQFDAPLAGEPNVVRPAPPFGGPPVPPPFRPSSNALVKRYVGRLTATASSDWQGSWPVTHVIDGEERTSWYARERGPNPRPWVEVRFPEPVGVRRVTVLGNRDPQYPRGYTVFAARVELRDAAGAVLAAADLTGQGDRQDFQFEPTPGRATTGVTAVRVVVTRAESLEMAALGEVQVE